MPRGIPKSTKRKATARTALKKGAKKTKRAAPAKRRKSAPS